MVEKLEKTAVKKGSRGVSVMLRKYRLRLAFRVLTAVVTVWVKDVDVKKHRIGLTMKNPHAKKKAAAKAQ